MWNLRNWKTVFVLSIILPAGLFTTSRFTGILHGPLTVTGIVTAETVSWNTNRSIYHKEINETLNTQ